ncbi:MAG TPA: hypothetical protein VL357_06180 [Rariglobus sp.]|jgi:hypothetical protein|nr:hypothetical protein [Rariglobus sp.]
MKSVILTDQSRGDFIAAALTGLWLFTWRAILGVPWGFQSVPDTASLTGPGILFNPGDTWCYLSWVQQYCHGANFGGLIYTTEPHSALMCLLPLWIIGKVAAWSGLSVIGVFNTAGLVGAMFAVFFFRRAATALRMPRSACDWATVALVAGSGGSWLWHIAHKLHLAGPANGGDLFFFDLFPSTAFLTYAYHSIGLALVAGLWWCTTAWENQKSEGGRTTAWALAVASFAILLGFSRPYEPIAFLGAWMLKTAWHGIHRKREPAHWRNSLTMGVLLSIALAPGIGWTLWVSRQPVWSSFASDSLALGLPRSAWVWTLAGWGVLATLGAVPAWRADRRRAILPVAATGLLVILLLGLGTGHAKLASGLMLGPILLAGWGCVRLVDATARLSKAPQIILPALGIGALIGIASFNLALNIIHLRGPVLIDSDMVALARKIPRQTSTNAPAIVLTDGETGTILPGLIGARVWVGHWSLSPHYKAKISVLRQAGLDPEHPPLNEAAADAVLTHVLADSHFDYALLDRRCHRVIATLEKDQWHEVSITPRWVLLSSQPSSR